eukprot:6201931-Pleurochrysis_carterae.AAC.2
MFYARLATVHVPHFVISRCDEATLAKWDVSSFRSTLDPTSTFAMLFKQAAHTRHRSVRARLTDLGMLV